MADTKKRILFASPHCVLDCASGAALATMDILQLLASRGCNCRAFCASKLDGDGQWSVVSGQSSNVTTQRVAISSDHSVELTHLQIGAVPVSVLRTQSARIEEWAPDEPQALLAAFDRILGDVRPDVLLTYGGDPVTRAMIHVAKQRGIRVVFGLHNFAYDDVSVFRDVDYVVVPSEFSAWWYEQRLGLDCTVLPYSIDWDRVLVRGDKHASGQEGEHGGGGAGEKDIDASVPEPRTLNPEPCYLTFVNPQLAKGVFVFARIAEQLQRRRPEIPILVVESRGAASWLEQTNLDLSWCQNLHAMENTHDPRDFYRVTKLLLVPSLWNESFGLVAAEAMINGIPVLASDRGALPEVMGRVEGGGRKAEGGGPDRTGGQRSGISGQLEGAAGGFLFDIPSRYTPEKSSVPTAEEVEPWVETIVRLWDDEKLYRECSAKARAHARRWHPDRLGPAYAEFFRNVRPKPGPPFLPREGVRGREGEGERAAARVQWSGFSGQ